MFIQTGSTSKLREEIKAAQDNGFAGELVLGEIQFNKNDPPQTFDDIKLTPNFPLLSTITMAAPSPDWITGMYKFSPIDQSNKVWYEIFEIATYPWDAGTEKGDTYSINNQSENPHVTIIQLTKDTVPDNGILLNPDGQEVLPIAVWTCDLISSIAPPCSDSEELRFKDRENRDCNWVGAVGKKKRKRKRKKRCIKEWEGRLLSDWCPETCGKC